MPKQTGNQPPVQNDALEPRLPFETWEMIFRFATSDSLQLDGTVSSYFPSYIKHMDQKRAIVLVSKLWNNLATHLLYESVLINKSEKLWQFYSMLKLKNNLYYGSEGKARQSYGSFIRILKIEGHMDAKRVAPTILSVLERCTNLKVIAFHIAGGGSVILHIVEAISKHHSKSLRYFETSGNTSSPALWDNLQHFPLLETISYSSGDSALFKSKTHSSFPRLHTLRVEDAYADILSHLMIVWNMPALQNLVLTMADPSHRTKGFFEAHGSKIRSLTLIGPMGHNHIAHFTSMQPYLTSLLQLSLNGRLNNSINSPVFLSCWTLQVQVDLDLTTINNENSMRILPSRTPCPISRRSSMSQRPQSLTPFRCWGSKTAIFSVKGRIFSQRMSGSAHKNGLKNGLWVEFSC
jgi:hypothetical protein